MLQKTRGIVFRFTRYGDTSIIANIFTQAFGLQSYLVNGVRSKTGRGQISLFQPLTLLDMVVYHRENANIMRIKEVRCIHAYQHIHQDIRKTTIALFLNEIINKVVRDQSNAETLYDFLMQSFIALDQLDGVENFHLQFLIQLSRHLGFGAHEVHEILEGERLVSEDDEALQQLLACTYADVVLLTPSSRRNLLELLLTFYQRHIESMGVVRSVDVLKEVLR